MSVPHTASPEALNALPHGPGFRFLSRLLRVEPALRAEGEWIVSGSEPFFEAHFPGEPVVPGVLIAEGLAQLSGLVVCSTGTLDTRAQLARVDVKFIVPVRPPAVIVMTSRFTRSLGNLHQFDVRAQINDRVAAEGVITLSAPPQGIR